MWSACFYFFLLAELISRRLKKGKFYKAKSISRTSGTNELTSQWEAAQPYLFAFTTWRADDAWSPSSSLLKLSPKLTPQSLWFMAAGSKRTGFEPVLSAQLRFSTQFQKEGSPFLGSSLPNHMFVFHLTDMNAWMVDITTGQVHPLWLQQTRLFWASFRQTLIFVQTYRSIKCT